MEENKLTTQEWKFTARDIVLKPDLFLSSIDSGIRPKYL